MTMYSDFTEKVRRTAERYAMLEDGDEVVVGLSGGADSTALLLSLLELRDDFGIGITAAHVNHGIRGAEAERDEAFCKRLCDRLGVRIYTMHVDIPALAKERGVSEEVAGRDARYEFFCGLAGERGKIATAHNAEDCVETMILNLCRGTGLRGLTGIPPVRTVTHKAGCRSDELIETLVFRPLVECTRAEILGYLSSIGQDYVTDSTNLGDGYTRNRIRHKVLPELLEVNGNAVGNIMRCMSTLKDDSAYLEEETDELLRAAKRESGFDTDTLQRARKPILSRAVSRMVFDACGRYPEKVHVDKAADMMRVGRTDQVQVPGGAFLRVENGLLFVVR